MIPPKHSPTSTPVGPANPSNVREEKYPNEQVIARTLESAPLLPRSAWQSKVSFVKTVFRVKKRLDEIEKLALSQT